MGSRTEMIKKLVGNQRLVGALVLVAAMALYAGTLSHDFNMDDVLVTNGHRLTSKGFAGIAEILRSPYYADESGYSYEYRPVTHISFAIEHELFGGSARSGHAINVLLFGLSGLLVLLLARLIAPPAMPLLPALATALFVAHPIHTEAVASIKNRDELLALVFALLAVAQAVRYGAAGGWWRLPILSGLLLLGLLSKSSVASFLFLVPAAAMLGGQHVSRISLSSASVVAPMAVYAHLRGWPASWLGVPLVLLALSLFVWAWTQPAFRQQCLRALRLLRPSHDPARLLLDRWGVLCLAVSAIVVVGAVILHDQRPLFALAILLLASPWLSGRYSVLPLVLLFLLTLQPVLWQNQFGSAFIALALMLALMDWSVGRQRLVFYLCASLIPMAKLGHAFCFEWDYFFGAGMSYRLLDLVLDPLFPLGPLALLHFYRCRPNASVWWTRLFYAIVLFSGFLLLVIGTAGEFGQVVFLLVYYVRFIRRQAPRPHAAAILLSVLVMASHPFWTKMVMTGGRPLSGHEVSPQHGDGLAPGQQGQGAQMPVGGTEQYRPLTFMEYPLVNETGLGIRLATASRILGRYMRMMFIPWPQSFYYGYDEVPVVGLSDPWAVLSAIVHLALLVLALYLSRSHVVLSFGILAYLSSILLFSNLISPVAGMVGDRLTYAASFGFSVALGYALLQLRSRLRGHASRLGFAMAVAVLLTAWSGMTVARNRQWKDALTLMRNDIKTVPRSAQAHNLLAVNLVKSSFEKREARAAAQLRLEALGHFKESIRLYPGFFNTWYDAGRVQVLLGDQAGALPYFMQAHRIDTSFFDATFQVAVISEQRGDFPTAIEYYGRAIRSSPEMGDSYGNLSYLLFRLGRNEESIAVNLAALRQNPGWLDPYRNIATVYRAMGDAAKAEEFEAMYRDRAR